jgi:hypothetical protein
VQLGSETGVSIAKLLICLLGAAFGLTGCVAADFEPLTMEGAHCKQECVQNMQHCEGSSYTCDRSYTLCIDACVDVEAKALKGGQ